MRSLTDATQRIVLSTGALAGSAVVAQLIGMAAAPALTRLYPPAAFGIAAAFTAIVQLSAATLPRYDYGIVVQRATHAAGIVLAVALRNALVAGSIVGLLVLAARSAVETMLSAPGLALALWLAPLAILGRAIYHPVAQWAYRQQHVRALARRTVLQAVGQVAVQGALAFTSVRALGIPAGITVGLLIGNGALLRTALRESAADRRRLTRRNARWARSRHRAFAVYGAFSGVLGRIATEAPLLLLVATHGTATGGQFALALKVIALPTTLVASAVSQAFLSEGARIVRQGGDGLAQLFERTTKVLGITGVVAFGSLAAAAPAVFPIVFSESWRPAGEFARLMAPWLLAAFVATGTSSALTVLSRPREQFRLDALRAGLGIGPVLMARAAGWGPETTVLVLSMAQCVAYLLQLGWIALSLPRTGKTSTPSP